MKLPRSLRVKQILIRLLHSSAEGESPTPRLPSTLVLSVASAGSRL